MKARTFSAWSGAVAMIAAAVIAIVSGAVGPVTPAGAAPSTGASAVYVSLVPARFLDTRVGGQTFDHQFEGGGLALANTPLTLTIAGRGQVPAGATGVALNVTVASPRGNGYLTAYPCGQDAPNASNLNFSAGQTVPNSVITKLSSQGTVCLFASAATDVIVDVSGYFPTGSLYQSLAPARLADTRIPASPTIDRRFEAIGPIAGGTTLALGTGGRAGVPADAAAAALNVTVTNPSADGYLTVYPCGTTPPNASNLNFVAGQTVPNAVISKLGDGGQICLFASVTTDVIVDVAGDFPATPAFTPLAPQRLLDTRAGGQTADQQFQATGPLADRASIDLQISGRGGVPTANVAAVVLNVTAVNPAGSGFLTVSPSGSPRPNASNLNFSPGQTVPNLVVVRLGPDGKVNLYDEGGPVHLIVDVAGYLNAPYISTGGGVLTCAITVDRMVDCWGKAKLGDGTTLPSTSRVGTGLTDIVELSVGAVHACARKQSGDAWCWGDNSLSQLGQFTTGAVNVPVRVALSNVTGIATGFEVTCAQLRGTDLACAGRNDAGQLGIGNTNPNVGPFAVLGVGAVKQVSIGENFGCLLRFDGTVACTGSGANGRLGNGSPANTTRYTTVAGLTDVVQLADVAPSGRSMCAIRSDTTVYCWGGNDLGQLGDGTKADAYLPFKIQGLTGSLSVALGSSHGCALFAGGVVKCWGSNESGQFGNGTTTDSLTPVVSTGFTDVTQLSAGAGYTCAIRAAAIPICSGSNLFAQLGDGTSTDRLVPTPVLGF